jgi:ClpX C4-type zinc finger
MLRQPPPPVICSARVVCYAFVDDLAYHESGTHFVNDVPLGRVPRLAIAVSLAEDAEPLLIYCDEEWELVGVSGDETIASTKRRAARNYPEVEARWIDTGVTHEEAMRYYDEAFDHLKCSFCYKRPFEVEGMVEGKGVAICRACIESFHDEFQASGGVTGVG